MCCSMVTVVRPIVHSDSETIYASHSREELAKQVLFSQRGLFLRTREAAIRGECLHWGRLISLTNARHEYHSRLIVDSEA